MHSRKIASLSNNENSAEVEGCAHKLTLEGLDFSLWGQWQSVEEVQSREWMRPLVHEVHAASSLLMFYTAATAAKFIMQHALLFKIV
jgi:hypothetical protein